MQKISLHANPFALMMDPEAVLAAMERSERHPYTRALLACDPANLEALAQEVASSSTTRRQERSLEDALPS